jgi:thioredoxin
MVFTFDTEDEFDAFVLDKKNQNKLIVVNFGASWCGPCKRFAPKYESMAEEFKEIARFVKVDINALEGLSQRYKIGSVPTFMFIENNHIMEQFVGADEQKIRSIFREWLYKSLQQKSSESSSTAGSSVFR